MTTTTRVVGPVLVRDAIGDAIVEAIRDGNAGAEVTGQGGYLRVSAPAPCVVSRAAIEARLGAPIALREELHRTMVSFAGRLELDDEVARWR